MHENQDGTSFANTKVKIQAGARYLGGQIGTEQSKDQFYTKKIEDITSKLAKLTDIARSRPHIAYTFFTKSLQHEVTFLQRICPGLEVKLLDFKSKLKNFVQVLVGRGITEDLKWKEISLPVRYGGMGLNVSYIDETTRRQYHTSELLTYGLKTKLKNQENGLPPKPNMLEFKGDNNKAWTWRLEELIDGRAILYKEMLAR